MRRHRQTPSSEPGGGPEAPTVPGPPDRNTDHHAVAAFQREGPVEGTVVRIHTTLSPAPFLKHPQLTPAQKGFLSRVAGPRSEERVYGLVNRHYLNVLHRSIRPGPSPQEQEDGPAPAPGPAEGETAAQEPEEPESKTGARAKHKQPIKTAAAKHPGKQSLAKPPAKRRRPHAKGQSPNAKQNKNKTETGSWSQLLGEDDPEASLRESLSSLSMEDELDSVYEDSPR